MKLLHIVPQIAQEASGPSYSVPRLCQSLAECGNDVELKCLAAAGDVPGVHITLHRQWPVLRRFEVSTDLARAMQRGSHKVDIIHNHSLWSMVNVAAGLVVPGHRAKLVTSPRGTLSPTAIARRKHMKRILWPAQRRVLERADLLHATSESEYTAIRELGLDVPVAIIPNGIDLPLVKTPETPGTTKTLLFVGRIHPVKGIDNLLRAWQQLQSEHEDWRLIIVGPGEEQHVVQIRNLAKALDIKRAHFTGPLFGAQKAAAYDSANLFVLPSHTENFGMVVAEALAHGCPAVVSHGAPWAQLEQERCGWWVRDDLEALRHCLDTAMGLSPQQLAQMGARGRQWMARSFGWESVGQRMTAAYRWLLDGGPVPSSVRVN